MRHLASSNISSLDQGILKAIYQKRWKVEGYDESLKLNAAVICTPLWSVCTLASRFQASPCAYARWEALLERGSYRGALCAGQPFLNPLHH